MVAAEHPKFAPIVGSAMKVADPALLSISMCAVTLPLYFAHALRHPALFWAIRVSIEQVVAMAACAIFWSSVLHAVGLYEARRLSGMRDLLLRLYTGIGFCSVPIVLLLHLRDSGRSHALPLVAFFTFSFVLTSFARGCSALFERLLRPHLRQRKRAIIVGADRRAEDLLDKLLLDRSFAYEVVGFVSPTRIPERAIAGHPVLGAIADLEHLLMCEHIDEVLVSLPVQTFYEEIRQVLQLCEASGVRSQYSSHLFETSVAKRRETEGANAERVILHMVHDDLRQSIKRAADVLGAALGLLLLSPVFLVIAALIKSSSPGPVFFSQVRYGLNKRRFPMFKFRSMVPDAEALQAGLEHLNETNGPAFKIKDDPRVTPVGRLLRKTSLDELPQLWNVLCGEMSLVGPRPLPMRDVRNFSELALVRRFSVKPGMTGLWQVSGRSSTSFEGWMRLDLHYIDHWSLVMDARILARTLPAVLRGSGAS